MKPKCTTSQRPAQHPFSHLRLWMEKTIVHEDVFYVERTEDLELRKALEDDRWVEVHGPRLMGKSSLLQHFEFTARREGLPWRVIFIEDALKTSTSEASTFAWVLGLATVVEERLRKKGDQFSGKPLQDAVCRVQKLGVSEWISGLCQALATLNPHLRHLIVLDEVDRLFAGHNGSHQGNAKLGQEIADAFSAVHSQRPAGVSFAFVGLQRFSALVEAHSAPAIGLGATIRMRDFSHQEWLDALGVASSHRSLASGLWTLSGGQPRLGNELIALAVERNIRRVADLPALEKEWLSRQTGDDPKSQLVDDIRRFWTTELDKRARELKEKLDTYEVILRDNYTTAGQPTALIRFMLDTGLVRYKERGRLQKMEVKAPLLAKVFDSETWVQDLTDQRAKLFPTSNLIAAPNTRKLLIINTGGTIGMFYDKKRRVVKATLEEFRKQYRHVFDDFPADFIEPFSLDSINVHPQDWSRLARLIYDKRHDYYAFVVAHGTDTMTHTASAVAFALGSRLNKPVIFTGAQATVDVSHGDALTNLYRACLVAQKSIPEVVIAFGNHLFRASRAQKMDEKRFEAFESPAYPALAVISEYVELREKYLRVLGRKDRGKDWVLRPDFSRDVLVIQLSPGMGVHYFDAALEVKNPDTGKKCEGVIIRTLGSGNIPTAPQDYAAFIRRAVGRGIPVLISSQYPWHPETHERFAPGAAGAQAGAILVPTMTPAAAETKFRWALAELEKLETPLTTASKRSKWVRDVMQTNIVDEIDEDPHGKTTHGSSHYRITGA